MTVWKPVPGYPDHEASDEGEIRTIKRTSYSHMKDGRVIARTLSGKVLYQFIARGCFCIAVVNPDPNASRPQISVPVHGLVALAFHGEPKEGANVRWRDGDRRNNRPDNLYWEYECCASNERTT